MALPPWVLNRQQKDNSGIIGAPPRIPTGRPNVNAMQTPGQAPSQGIAKPGQPMDFGQKLPQPKAQPTPQLGGSAAPTSPAASVGIKDNTVNGLLQLLKTLVTSGQLRG